MRVAEKIDYARQIVWLSRDGGLSAGASREMKIGLLQHGEAVYIIRGNENIWQVLGYENEKSMIR